MSGKAIAAFVAVLILAIMLLAAALRGQLGIIAGIAFTPDLVIVGENKPPTDSGAVLGSGDFGS